MFRKEKATSKGLAETVVNDSTCAETPKFEKVEAIASEEFPNKRKAMIGNNITRFSKVELKK